MGQGYRLRSLQVRIARQVRRPDLAGPLQQHPLQPHHPSGEGGELALAPEAQGRRDLVVAAAAGVELGAGRARQLGHAPFDGGVDVLVAGLERKRALPELLPHAVEGGPHQVRLVLAQDPRAG